MSTVTAACGCSFTGGVVSACPACRELALPDQLRHLDRARRQAQRAARAELG